MATKRAMSVFVEPHLILARLIVSVARLTLSAPLLQAVFVEPYPGCKPCGDVEGYISPFEVSPGCYKILEQEGGVAVHLELAAVRVELAALH